MRSKRVLLVALVVVVAGVAPLGTATAAPAPPAVTATPTTNLVDRQVITVTGSGLSTSTFPRVQFRVCTTDGAACYRISYSVGVDALGRFSTPLVVPRRPFVIGQEPATVDCAVVACRLEVTVDGVANPFLIPLTFDPAKPFTPQVVDGTPKTGLGYFAIVNVTASGFDQRAVGLLAPCYRRGAASYCGSTTHVRTGFDNGTFTYGMPVIRRVYVASQLRTYDCTDAGTTCEIAVRISGLDFTIPLTFDPAAPVPPITVGMGDDSITEGSVPETHTIVTMSEATDHPITIQYTTRHDTARPGIDYVKKVRHMTFLPGQTRHVIRIAIVDDDSPEPTERFRIDIDSIAGAGAAVGRGRQYTTIFDDD